MKTRLQIISLVGVLSLVAVPGAAGTTLPTLSLPTVSDTAGGTLLLPYFEVDLRNPTGMDTIFSINNMGATYNTANGATATLAHVVIWSDLGVPVFNFNVYLTGYDVQLIDLRNVLAGSLPRTASAGQDPQDTNSPKGILSQDINFASCNTGIYSAPVNSYSRLPPAPLTQAQINNLQTSLTGQASANMGGMCAGLPYGDNIARGYVTIDLVNNCTPRFPADAGYFGAGGTGDVTNQSLLTGEVFYVDQLHAIARGDNLVHIHASGTDPLTSTSGNYTFYGSYNGFTALDNRQPLPTEFGARFVNGNFTLGPVVTPTSPAWGMPPASPPPGSTSLIVWRDTKVAQGYFSCNVPPSWFPLPQEGLVAFDEQEHPQVVSGSTLFTFPIGFPAAAQVVQVGGSQLPVSFASGWLFLDLNATVSGQVSGQTDAAAAQGWVQVIEQNGSQIFNIIHRAQALDSGTSVQHFTPGS